MSVLWRCFFLVFTGRAHAKAHKCTYTPQHTLTRPPTHSQTHTHTGTQLLEMCAKGWGAYAEMECRGWEREEHFWNESDVVSLSPRQCEGGSLTRSEPLCRTLLFNASCELRTRLRVRPHAIYSYILEAFVFIDGPPRCDHQV